MPVSILAEYRRLLGRGCPSHFCRFKSVIRGSVAKHGSVVISPSPATKSNTMFLLKGFSGSAERNAKSKTNETQPRGLRSWHYSSEKESECHKKFESEKLPFIIPNKQIQITHICSAYINKMSVNCQKCQGSIWRVYYRNYENMLEITHYTKVYIKVMQVTGEYSELIVGIWGICWHPCYLFGTKMEPHMKMRDAGEYDHGERGRAREKDINIKQEKC